MAFPSGVTTATISLGTMFDFRGEAVEKLTATVKVLLGGNATKLNYRGTGQTVVPTEFKVSASNGMLDFRLPHVDQGGFYSGDGAEAKYWAYSITIQAHPEGSPAVKWVKYIQPVVGQDIIDLDNVPDGGVTSYISTPKATVTSVNGLTGDVQVDVDTSVLETRIATMEGKPWYIRGFVASTDTLDSLGEGSWAASNTTIAKNLGVPSQRPGTVIVSQVSVNGSRTAMYVTLEAAGEPPRLFVAGKISGVWSAWEEVTGGSSDKVIHPEPPSYKFALRDGLTARKGGVIGTNGKGVVSLRFDDAPVEFREKVLPMLASRGLPFTRVIPSYSIHDQVIPETEWPLLETLCLDNGGEVWNHGKTHGDASASAMDEEIIGARNSLRAAMPKLAIDCFAPPGGSITYAGNMPSNTSEAWATEAGNMIWSGHALVTGYRPDAYYWPIDGALRDGQNHYSVDLYDATRAKQLVGRARDWGVGVVLMWHSNNFDTASGMTLSDFAATLDYIVAQRDAGNILVLTVSGTATANKFSSQRDNILRTSSGTGSFSETILYPLYRRNIPGSTRELTATVTGTPGQSVVSTIGSSTKNHTIPESGTLLLRHMVTIPQSPGTSMVVSIDATASNVKLLAV